MTIEAVIDVHGDQMYAELKAELDRDVAAWWDGARPETWPRDTVWNVAGRVFVLLRDAGLAVVDLQVPDYGSWVLTLTRIPQPSRHLFNGANVVVALHDHNTSIAVVLERGRFTPDWLAANGLEVDHHTAVPIAELLSTIAAAPTTFVAAGHLDMGATMPGQ